MPKGSFNASKTHCPQGHPHDAENTYVMTNGGRRCRRCAADYQARRWQDDPDHRERRRAYKRELRRRKALVPIVMESLGCTESEAWELVKSG